VGAFSTCTVKQWDPKLNKNVDVQCPSSVMHYNKFTEGMDLMDLLIALYRTKVRSKKWYHSSFFHFLDMKVVNS
jgi:hypothetical protein